MAEHWTYQLKYVRCGKPRCRCATGLGHGPYWYRARHDRAGVHWRYVGKIREHHRASWEQQARAEGATAFAGATGRWAFTGRMTEPTALRILAFDRLPTAAALKARWRELVTMHHPDRGGSAAVCAAINAAYTWAKGYVR